MPNDAKLGLVVGVGLVLAVAVVFFHKDDPAARPASMEPAAVRGESRDGIPLTPETESPDQPSLPPADLP